MRAWPYPQRAHEVVKSLQPLFGVCARAMRQSGTFRDAYVGDWVSFLYVYE